MPSPRAYKPGAPLADVQDAPVLQDWLKEPDPTQDTPHVAADPAIIRDVLNRAAGVGVARMAFGSYVPTAGGIKHGAQMRELPGSAAGWDALTAQAKAPLAEEQARVASANSAIDTLNKYNAAKLGTARNNRDTALGVMQGEQARKQTELDRTNDLADRAHTDERQALGWENAQNVAKIAAAGRKDVAETAAAGRKDAAKARAEVPSVKPPPDATLSKMSMLNNGVQEFVQAMQLHDKYEAKGGLAYLFQKSKLADLKQLGRGAQGLLGFTPSAQSEEDADAQKAKRTLEAAQGHFGLSLEPRRVTQDLQNALNAGTIPTGKAGAALVQQQMANVIGHAKNAYKALYAAHRGYFALGDSGVASPEDLGGFADYLSARNATASDGKKPNPVDAAPPLPNTIPVDDSKPVDAHLLTDEQAAANLAAYRARQRAKKGVK